MDYAYINDMVEAAITALDAGKNALPQGELRKEIEAKLLEAESAMKHAKEWQRRRPDISGGDKGVNYHQR
jgi:hypothetical protein